MALAGALVPASALEPLVHAARVRDYEPSHLDELTSSGEVLWAGHAALPGSDGWLSLHLADQAHLTLPDVSAEPPDELQQRVLEALAPGGAWFFRQLSDAVRVTESEEGGETRLQLPSQGSFRVEWFDPRNGGPPQAGSVEEVQGGGSVSIGAPPSTPGEDWVALVRRVR